MSEQTERELPIWDSDALSRLLGACDGYIHCLLAVRGAINQLDGQYAPKHHPRHVRKIERKNAILKPLRALEATTETDLRQCQATYRKEYERARAQQEKR